MEIVTARLLIRPPRPADAEAALEMLRDPETVRWNSAPDVTDLAEATAWCERGADWSRGDHATWHAVDPENGQLVANISVFAIDREQGVAKVGYRVAPGRRSNGFGREALIAVTGWALRDQALTRIQLEHAVENAASCAMARAAGYQREGLLRSSYLDPDGVRHDEHVHGRLATDTWPSA